METINDIESSYLEMNDNLSIDEKKRVEQKLIEQKLIEQKLIEQKLIEQKLIEQKLIEQKLIEQKLIEQSEIELINELFSNDIIEKSKEIKHTTIWKGKCSKKGRKTNK